jgi:hypothetical protein
MPGTLHEGGLLGFCSDEIEGLTDGRDAFQFFFRHLDAEFFFESHDELDKVEAVGFEVFFETGVTGDLGCINRQQLNSALGETIE